MDHEPDPANRQVVASRTPEEQANILRALYDRTILTWKLIWDKRVGMLPKIIPLLAVAYVLSPLDLLSFPTVGALVPLWVVDDIGVILLGLNLFIQASPPDIVREHLRELGAWHAARRDPGDNDDDDVIDSTAERLDE
nr:hypothetical protein [Anaerolineae bacterium]